MERIWFRTWSGLVWLVRVTLYCGWKTKTQMFLEHVGQRRRHQVILCTRILRGPSRRARFLLGVSMLIILSRPLSREPKTLAPRFFFPLSPITAMSRDRDLGRTPAHRNLGSSKEDGWKMYTLKFAAGNSPPLRTEGQNSNVCNLLILS